MSLSRRAQKSKEPPQKLFIQLVLFRFRQETIQVLQQRRSETGEMTTEGNTKKASIGWAVTGGLLLLLIFGGSAILLPSSPKDVFDQDHLLVADAPQLKRTFVSPHLA